MSGFHYHILARDGAWLKITYDFGRLCYEIEHSPGAECRTSITEERNHGFPSWLYAMGIASQVYSWLKAVHEYQRIECDCAERLRAAMSSGMR